MDQFQLSIKPSRNAFEGLINQVVEGLSEDSNEIDFSKYDCAIEFGEEVLGEFYTDDVKELMRSVRDNVSTIGKSANATGKSHAAARIALWFLLRYPGSQVYTGAAPPESNLRNILWGELGLLLEKHKHLFRNFKVNDMKVTAKDNKKYFLTGVTIPTSGTPAKREAAFSGKHAPHMLFILDEADGIPPEVYRGIESCMSGGHVRLLMIFNPRHESGPVYIKERTRTAHVVEMSAFRHPNVMTGNNVIPGAVDRTITLRRIHKWTMPLRPGEKPDGECYEVPDFLVGTTALAEDGTWFPNLDAGWRRIIEPSFAYMVLGRYPSAGEGQLISRAWCHIAMERYQNYVAIHGAKPQRGMRPALGLDVAEFGKDQNALCRRYGGLVLPIEVWGGVDPTETADTAIDKYHEYKALRCAVDGTGVGSGVAPTMERHGCEAYSVKVASSPTFEVDEGEFTQLRDQLWWLTRLWLRHDPTAMLPPDDELIDELTTPTYDKGSKGKIKVMEKDEMKEKLGRSPDKAESLILTFFNETVESEDINGPLGQALLRHRGQ
jgi:hypothetical protein